MDKKKMKIKLNFKQLLELDLRSLVLFRVGLALLIMFDLFSRLSDIRVFYSDEGIFPRIPQLQSDLNSWFFSIYYANGTVGFQFFLFFIEFLFALLLLIGYRTKFSTFIIWFFHTSMHVRCPVILDGADWYFRLLLFWSIFLPLGAYCSVDRALSSSNEKISKSIFCVGNIAIFLQTAYMYWFSVVVKLHNVEWAQGYAVYYSLSEIQYASDLGFMLLHALPMNFLRFLGHLVLLIEIFSPALLFGPSIIRWVGILSIFFMQIGFGLCLDIIFFPFVCICALFPFIPTSFWDKLISKQEASLKTNLDIHYDGENSNLKKLFLILKTLFLLSKTNLISQDTSLDENIDLKNNKFMVIDYKGIKHFGVDGFYAIFNASPILSPFLPILRTGIIKDLLSNYCKKDFDRSLILNHLDYKPLKTNTKLVTNIFLIILLTYSYFANIEHVDPERKIPDQYKWVGSLLHIDQWWFMFASLAPSGEWYNFWLVIPGTFKDGSQLDFFNRGKQVQWDKPKHVSSIYKNRYWKKLLIVAGKGNQTNQLSNYAFYLCREWNLTHKEEKRLEKIDFYGMYERVLQNYKLSPTEKFFLLEYQCPKT